MRTQRNKIDRSTKMSLTWDETPSAMPAVPAMPAPPRMPDPAARLKSVAEAHAEQTPYRAAVAAMAVDAGAAAQAAENAAIDARFQRVRAEENRVINGKSDVNQLVPFKYKWAWDK